MTSKTFKEAYDVLQQHAQTLRSQQEPNIDDLLTIVTESVGAYKVCQERIDAVEKALEKALSDTGPAAKDNTPMANRTPPPQTLMPDESDDIPF
ncbi:exodeoxyribonuclease VII small subunit [Rhodoferax ferrireducens]|uniref:exodeoxyribonuclease VII small subunit n=1 Tax=Rhodoferax ferrireducens TaxID=192843 RepID=UPI000E0DB0C3|nr:exodeoxyribonuclease VII small subunit [Rhodoferax ferrireducens]